jgi:hypothetical protein
MTEILVNRSYKQQLREILLEEIEGESSVNLPELANRVADIVRANEELASGLIAEVVRPYVYQQGTQIFAQTRGEPIVELGDEVVGRSEFEARAKTLSSRFARWMEHANGRYVNFMEMTKADLEDAARQRKTRATTELKIAEFQLYVSRTLKKKSEKVGDRYTPSEVDEMWTKAYKEED